VQADLGVEAAGVLLYEPHGQTLQPTAGRGFEAPLAQTEIRLGEALAGYAAWSSAPCTSPTCASTSASGPASTRTAQLGFVGYWAVPMLTKGQLQGVIELYTRRPLVPDAEWFEFLETFADQGAIAVESAQLFRSLERSNVELQLAYDRTIEGWAYALDLKDEETAGHSKRVTRMTVRVAQRVGMDARDIVHVQRGALLHDIGKMGVPDSILLKRGPLTPEERKEIEQHPVYAFELLSPIEFLRPALDIPYCHHEKWDGSGYPRGLVGEQIPLAARIFAIVDVFDALTSDRPYRAAWDRARTLAYIQEQSGSHFDPELVKAFWRSSARTPEPRVPHGGGRRETPPRTGRPPSRCYRGCREPPPPPRRLRRAPRRRRCRRLPARRPPGRPGPSWRAPPSRTPRASDTTPSSTPDGRERTLLEAPAARA
jgi:hypothetical protein